MSSPPPSTPPETEFDAELAEAVRLSLEGLHLEAEAEVGDPLPGGAAASPQPEAEPEAEVVPEAGGGGSSSASLSAGRDIRIIQHIYVSADDYTAELAARGRHRVLAAANRGRGSSSGGASSKASAPSPAPAPGGQAQPKAAAPAPPPAAAGGACPAAAHHGAAPGSSAPATPARAEPTVLSLAEARTLVATALAAGVVGRAYAVWRTPGSGRVLVGVHIGARCWDCLVRWLEGGRYVSGRDRLRGADNLDAAVRLYEGEAQRHLAPVPPQVFRWP